MLPSYGENISNFAEYVGIYLLIHPLKAADILLNEFGHRCVT